MIETTHLPVVDVHQFHGFCQSFAIFLPFVLSLVGL
jgi:hypothetical protein